MSVVDDALMALVERREKIAKIKVEVDELVEQINALAGNDDIEQGTVALEGEKLKAKITRRMNAKYSDKQKLSQLLADHKDALGSLFRVEVKESGQKVEKFLVSSDQTDLIEQIAAIRTKAPGKPTIEVSPLGG